MYMKTNSPKSEPRLKMQSVFRYMMEAGYYPQFEYTHIQFDINGCIAVLEIEDGFASIRLFFSIDEAEYDLFIEASNMTMLKTYAVKPAVMDDRQNIVFSYEFLCDDIRAFRKIFPRAVEQMEYALETHREEMRRLKTGRQQNKLPDIDDLMSGSRKILS